MAEKFYVATTFDGAKMANYINDSVKGFEIEGLDSEDEIVTSREYDSIDELIVEERLTFMTPEAATMLKRVIGMFDGPVVLYPPREGGFDYVKQYEVYIKE